MRSQTQRHTQIYTYFSDSLKSIARMVAVKALVTEPMPKSVDDVTFWPDVMFTTPKPLVRVSLPLTTARVSPGIFLHSMSVLTNSSSPDTWSGSKTDPWVEDITRMERHTTTPCILNKSVTRINLPKLWTHQMSSVKHHRSLGEWNK